MADPTAVCRKLDELHPVFRARVVAAVEQANRESAGKFDGFRRWVIFETYRSQERQDWLYAQGRTRPGPRVTWTRRSAHTSRKAADVVWRDEAGRLRWDGPAELWARLGHAARAQGLVWGGDWKGGKCDRPHVQAAWV